MSNHNNHLNLNPNGNHFFLVVPIGLEESAKDELLEWCGVLATEFGRDALVLKATVVKGGVEFQIGSSYAAFLLNACLKLSSRLLQRIHIFHTREWPVLEKELKSIAWKEYFSAGISEWQIAASESRMNNEKHLAQFLQEKLEKRHYVVKESGTVAYLRVHDNVFTLSRDTSGEHLHFRGYRKRQGEAPLRENLAAFLWSFLIRHRSRLQAEKALIIDPFVGSGTLLSEAVLWNQVIESRSYPSMKWVAEDKLKKFESLKTRLTPWTLNVLGVDSDPEVLEKAQINLKNLINTSTNDLKNKPHGDKQKINPTIAMASTYSLLQGDSTHLSTELKKALSPKIQNLSQNQSENRTQSLWLLSNPPYGGKGRIKSEKSWKVLWEGALQSYQPDWAVAVGPERECRKDEVLGMWKCVDTQRFLNGGIRVMASLWKK